MSLRLSEQFEFGILSKQRRPEPGSGPWLPAIEEGRALTELIDRLGYDSQWFGDHLSFPLPVLDPLVQLAQAATFSSRLVFGTSVYLLPLRHPGPAAKQLATLDHLSDGRMILGVGVGGEFKTDFQAAGVDPSERGARLSEGIEVLRKLWRGEPVSHDGRYYSFPELTMSPPARQPGGPPIWCGGRSPAALRRAGEICDGWLSYVVTPEMYRQALDQIREAAAAAAGPERQFGTGHLLFARVDDTYENALDEAAKTLSARYAMDFREPAKKYSALGGPQDVAERLMQYHEAGLRHVVLDFLGPYEDHDQQISRFAEEVLPLVKDLR